ncbi:hypothetical protein DFR60_104325 [Hungatella effluvii]|uniref:Uncharacterized protein n=1 Tax=Hungatella effluvii TaxID=1096246 RepID=A0A2V3Y732_9FIRM|nr:hypothetical protein [Hungatella effluvii]PXX54498.1 hypothetical protein DFR60_104325 [Hungatella effluvii]
MKHLNRLAALALSVSMGISGCAFAPASSASSETVSSTYEKDTDNGETFSAESADSEETSIDDTGEAFLSPSEQSSETEEENASETESERAAAFALKIKKAVASADMEGFADLCGYPVYISLESGDGRELETRDDLIALGSDTLFTHKMKDTIAAVQESQLDSYGAGVMMGENGAVVFNDVNGTMMITGINLSD